MARFFFGSNCFLDCVAGASEPILSLEWAEDDEALKYKFDSPVQKRPCTIVDLPSDTELEADVIVKPSHARSGYDYIFNKFVKWGEVLAEVGDEEINSSEGEVTPIKISSDSEEETPRSKRLRLRREKKARTAPHV